MYEKWTNEMFYNESLFARNLIVQFRIHHDRWIKALTTHLYRVSFDLKWNIRKFQREDALFTALCIV